MTIRELDFQPEGLNFGAKMPSEALELLCEELMDDSRIIDPTTEQIDITPSSYGDDDSVRWSLEVSEDGEGKINVLFGGKISHTLRMPQELKYYVIYDNFPNHHTFYKVIFHQNSDGIANEA